jgi:hypothetical protein
VCVLSAADVCPGARARCRKGDPRAGILFRSPPRPRPRPTHTFLHRQINPFRVRRSGQWQCRNAVQPPIQHPIRGTPPPATALERRVALQLLGRGEQGWCGCRAPWVGDRRVAVGHVGPVATPGRRVASNCGNGGSAAYPRLPRTRPLIRSSARPLSFCRNFRRGGGGGRGSQQRVAPFNIILRQVLAFGVAVACAQSLGGPLVCLLRFLQHEWLVHCARRFGVPFARAWLRCVDMRAQRKLGACPPACLCCAPANSICRLDTSNEISALKRR